MSLSELKGSSWAKRVFQISPVGDTMMTTVIMAISGSYQACAIRKLLLFSELWRLAVRLRVFQIPPVRVFMRTVVRAAAEHRSRIAFSAITTTSPQPGEGDSSSSSRPMDVERTFRAVPLKTALVINP